MTRHHRCESSEGIQVNASTVVALQQKGHEQNDA